MSIAIYKRLSSMFPPERELLTIEDDGSFTMWRSFGAQAVGRFGGTVPEPGRMATLASAAAGAEPPATDELDPDASIESLELGGRLAEVEGGTRLNGPWGDALSLCREWLRSLVEAPSAAISGSIDRAGIFQLQHRGSDVLPIELASLEVRVVRWSGGVEAATVSVRPGNLGRVEAGPGWAAEIPFDNSVFGEGQVVGTATFVAVDAGVFVPVVVTVHSDGQG